MSVSKSLERLLHVREIQEELRKRDLAAAAINLARLERADASAAERVIRGRKLLFSALDANDLCERLVGQAEIEWGELRQALLKNRVENMKSLAEEIRADVIDKRLERQQVETVVEAAEAQVEIEMGRKTQQSLDDWFLTQQDGRASNDIPTEEPNRKMT